ncbi:unnamed protein product [Oreochromis niloticus]|nr:unnamed protein product [Mustela putorius furo]
MMQLYAALILSVTLSTASGIICYKCTSKDPTSCTYTETCYSSYDHCYSTKVGDFNLVTKGCQTSAACIGSKSCCKYDLCNGATPTGPGAILLLVSSIILKFLF